MCLVDSCRNKAVCKGYCHRHYMQILRHGHILKETVEDLQGEEWRRITDLSGKKRVHFVSNLGRVKTKNKYREVLIKKTFTNRPVVVYICCDDNKKVKRSIPKLVLNAFKDNPFNDTRYVLTDGDNKNLKIDNIEWYGVYWHDRAVESLTNEGSDLSNQIVGIMRGDDHCAEVIIERFTPLLATIFYEDFGKNNPYLYNLSADDFIQEAWMKALDIIKRGGLRNTNNIPRWFSTIFKHICIDELKAQKKKNLRPISYNDEVEYKDTIIC